MEPTPFLLSLLVPGVLVPAATAAGILACARWTGRSRGERFERGAGAVAFGSAFLAAYLAFPWTPWRPEEPWDWIPYLVILAALAEILATTPVVPQYAGWGLRVAVVAGCAWLLVPALPDLESVRLYWVVRTAAVIGLLWFVLQHQPAEAPGPLAAALLTLVAAAAAVLTEAAGILKLAQFAGALASILGVCAVLSCGRRPRAFFAGMAPGVAVVLPGLLFNCYFYSSSKVPLTSYLHVLAAPLTLAAGTLAPVQKLGPRPRLLLQSVAVLLPAILGLALALLAYHD